MTRFLKSWNFIQHKTAATAAAAKIKPSKEGEIPWELAKPYKTMPGPKPMPLVGNTWRFIPYIGKPK